MKAYAADGTGASAGIRWVRGDLFAYRGCPVDVTPPDVSKISVLFAGECANEEMEYDRESNHYATITVRTHAVMQQLRGRIERDGQLIVEETELTLDAPEEGRVWHVAFTASAREDRVESGEKYTVVLEDGRKGDCLITDQDTSVVGAPGAPHVVAVGLQPLYKV